MSFPTIVVHSSTGSDSLASGAGPGDGTTAGSALTGTAASTSSDGLTVTLDGSPDLTAVDATNGTHVIYLADATAGARNFGKITAKDNTAKTVTVSNAFGLSLTGKSWAIGGKRQFVMGNAAGSATSTTLKLLDNNGSPGDAMPGWTIEPQSGHAEAVGAAAGPSGDGILRFRRAGDATSGPIILRGKPGAATTPALTFANNSIAVYLSSSYTQAANLDLRNSFSPKTGSIAVQVANGSVNRITGIKAATSASNFWKGVVHGGSGLAVRDCEFGYAASHGLDFGAGLYVRLRALYLHDCGGNAVNVTVTTGNFSLRGSIVAGNAAGLVLAGFSTTQSNRVEIEDNTFHNNAGAAIDIQAGTDALNNMGVVNNVLSGGTHGLKFSSGSHTDALIAAEAILVADNNTYNNSTAAYLSATGGYTNANCPWATGDPGLNPTFTNAAGGDYSIGANLKGLGYPTANVGTTSATTSYVDIGAAQRQETGGGTYTSAANVRLNTDRGDGTLGTLIVPSAANVLSGTTFDATTAGTATVPTAAQVLSTVTAYGAGGTALAGNVTLPVVGDVRSGTHFGPSNASVGTLVVSGGTYTAAANVRNGTDRGDGTLGTLVVPAASTVLIGTTYDASTAGTVTLPIVGDVESGVTFGASLSLTGTFVVPTTGNVANLVGYGAGGTEFTGSLTGGSGPSAAAIATAVWQDLIAGPDFSAAGSAGAVLKASLTSSGALVSSGTGTGQLSVASGVVAANMTQTNGSAVSLSDGQARAGSSSTITLALADSAVANAYVDRRITVAAGAGAGQSRVVTAYDSTTKIATVHRAWDVPPDSTSQYAIDPTSVSASVVSTVALTAGSVSSATFAAVTPGLTGFLERLSHLTSRFFPVAGGSVTAPKSGNGSLVVRGTGGTQTSTQTVSDDGTTQTVGAAS